MGTESKGTTRDFRARVIWIYVVMFATQGFFYHHRRPLLSWTSLIACALLLTGAMHYRIQRRRALNLKDKVSNVS